MRITIVGLGPGPASLLSVAAAEALHSSASVFARTRLHPALSGVSVESFDDLYTHASSLASVEAAMVARLLDSSSSEDVVLAVPGDGVLGESVLAALRAAGGEVTVVPGVPLGLGALAAVELDASSGAQFVEATALQAELNPRWAAVVTGVFSRAVASDLKLTLQHVYPAEHSVWLVHHPGLADASTLVVPLADLDRASLELDHLTHVVLPPVPFDVPTGSAHGLRAIVSRLRDPVNGCPWDLEQTHRSLIPYVVEEAYEVVDAIEDSDTVGLAEELGDVLLQVALHAELGDQAGEFDWNDVVRLLSAKLIRRHPHVFGSVEVNSASDVVRNWEIWKAAERSSSPPPSSALDGVPRSLPGLKRAAETAKKAVNAGFEWPSRSGTLDKVREELAELLAAESLEDRTEELGDLLWIIAKLAWQDGIDPEAALHAANKKFVSRFHLLEQIAAERGWSTLSEPPFADLNAAWTEAKARLAAQSRP